MNFLVRFFRKKPVDRFLAYSPQDSKWRVVSWNFDLKEPKSRQWALEVKGVQKNYHVEWHRNAKDELRFFEGSKLIDQTKCVNGDGNRELMNIALHSTIKFGLESNHDFLLTPVSGATTLDFQNEAKALQWLQASFGTLGRALDQLKERKDLILTAAVFSGVEPGTESRVLRVLVFNLDIFLYMREDFSLLIAVFDDKNMGHGTSKTPTFQQEIKVTKPQIYDEIVKLVQHIATVGDIS